MQKISPEYLMIQVDTKNCRIFFPVTHHDDAELKYKLHPDSKPTVMEFESTFVPKQIRHQGIGSQLVEKGMRFAMANQYSVKASCPFVEYFLEQHPEFQSMKTELV